MADRNAPGKVQIYFTIYRLNLSFSNIVSHCRTLQESGVLTESRKKTSIAKGQPA